ncbi:MAG TPA: hydrolase TatD [Cytophagales bacterium]|nr:hydrolase TatD [Cytophagales bacterium]HCR53877.1 hydrolase TatD [Cytophagales bacterium]
MNYWTDSHAHIYLKEFDADGREVMLRCEEAGVQKIYMPNIDHTSIDNMLEWEAKYPNQCLAMMGLHPCSVKNDFEKELYLVENWLSKRKFAAIGEMGTDLYWDKTFWEQQQEAFAVQVSWAKRYELPIVIHCRESIDETIAMVEQYHDEKLKGVFHCFTGTIEQAKRIVKLGFYLGLGGVSTFKNGGLDKIIPELDVNTLLLETDSPYLSPVPHRGKRNEPSYIPIIATRVAELLGISLEDLQTATSVNAQNLFVK